MKDAPPAGQPAASKAHAPADPDGPPETAGTHAGRISGETGTTGVGGVVRAGGRSSRLGEDKARLRLGPRKKYGSPNAVCPAPADRPGREWAGHDWIGRERTGPDMLTRTLRLLRACTDDVAVSCQSSRDVRPWRRIPDEREGMGPIGAICSILRAEQRPVLVLSCDLPFMTGQVLRRLLAARAARPSDALMTVFRQTETGYIEPLVAVYEPACRPWFEAAVAAGKRRLGNVIPESLRACVPYGREEALPFFNINYPADLEAARLLAEHRAHKGSGEGDPGE